MLILLGLCGRMSINFKVSRSRDIAFHLNPRVREGVVVRNSMVGGTWGQEEKQISINPFKEGQYFDVSIVIHSYILYYNGDRWWGHLSVFYSCFSDVDSLWRAKV